MGRLQLKNVTERHGHLYFRRKIGGKDTYVRLPAIDSPDFLDEYTRLSAPEPAARKAAKGTIAALVIEYRGSQEWQRKDSKTCANQGRFLDWLAEKHGHRTVAGIRPSHIYKMRDEFKDKPGNAAILLSVLKSLMKYAMQIDWRDSNPAAEVPMLAIGEHEPWPADLLQVCLAEATPMTRLAIITGLCSGQRIGDCVRMQYGWINDGIMEFPQQKRRKGGVRKHVAVPMHPLWIDELAKLARCSVTLLYDRTNKPFRDAGAIQERLRDLMEKPAVKDVLADLIAREMIAEGARFTFHGLRKNACCYLLECGLNDSEVGEILGMSPEMVRHYGKRARALMIARGAAQRMTGGTVAILPGARATAAEVKK